MVLKAVSTQLISIFLLTVISMHSNAAEQRPNILMFIVDDLAAVGTTFGGSVNMPSIDALAARGVSFTNNYANIPVCGASRASMLSGLAPTSTRFLTFDSRLDEDVPDTISLPAFFRSHGWFTAANGKIFDVIADSKDSWSEPVWSPDSQWFGKASDHRGEHLQAAYLEPFSSTRFPYAEKLPVDDDAYPDGQVATKSIADLHRLSAKNTPFFLAVGFRKPHLPFNAPERYWRDETPAENLPTTWTQTGTNIPFNFAAHRSPELRMQYDALPLFGEPSPLEASNIIAAYHAAARYADAQVGRVLDALQQTNARENTIVLLMGDHGFLLGHYKLWTKHALFEPALKTPLIVVDPRRPRVASVTAITDLLDIYPTLVELAGLQTPVHLDGKTLRPLLENPSLTKREVKSSSISRWQNGESIRDTKYRYTRWYDEHDQTLEEMLFDLANDPHETNNLAKAPHLSSQIELLRNQLAQRRQGPVWSDTLDTSVHQWNLLTSPLGNLIILIIVHPILTGLSVIVLLVCVSGFAWSRMRSKSSR